MWSKQSTYLMCVLQLSYCCWLYSIHHRNFPCWWKSACLSLCVHFICLATLGLSYIPLTPVFMSPHFNFIFCPKFLRINFLFGLTVPQQCTVLVCKSSNNAEDEMMMSTYSLCPMFSILAAHSVTTGWLAVTEGVCLNAQSNCTCITIRKLEDFYPKLCFFSMYH